ncbi:MAG: LysM peptidoglycan-binding domain-containing protein [Spirochaetales bacterium]|nr:LysM peptidoglycan-binding domain-containing protein [Spirochaetales bacterium]
MSPRIFLIAAACCLASAVAAQSTLPEPSLSPLPAAPESAEGSAATPYPRGLAPSRRSPPPPAHDAADVISAPNGRHHAAEYRFDIEPPWGEARFERFLASYRKPDGLKRLERALDRAEPYLDWIKERIAAYDLPAELAWLPVIESDYHPWAVSKSGAVGLWQFMLNSIAGYDMRVDEWVDERRDFMKATDGALRKLAYNHAQLGDWYLALAAYNAGLGAVQRAIVAAGTRDYFELCARGFLKSETADYVPKLMAAAVMLSYPGRSGLEPRWNGVQAWETVSLDKPVDLALLAEAAGVPLARLREGNAELAYSVSPPDRSWNLKVPAEFAEPVRSALARSELQLMRFHLYTVRSGDTLSALSRHYDASVALILRFNPGLRPEALRIGARVVIPALKDVAPYVPPDAPRDDRPFDGTHVVSSGETLWALARIYDVRPETLAERNGMALDAIIREGQSLKVPILDSGAAFKRLGGSP